MTMYHLEFAQRVGLLRQNKSFRNFWLARLLSFFGDTLAKVALTIYASRLEGGATLVGWLLVAHTLPWLLGPLAGVVADHSEQRRLMVLCEIGQGMLFIGITLSLSSFPMVLILIFLATMLATLFSPSGNSALPLIVRAEDISIANALLGFSYNLGYALGPVVAGLLVLWWDVQVVLMLNCLTFVFSVVLLLKLPPLSTASSLTISQVWTSFREGLSYTFNHKTTRAVTLGLFAVVVFGALDNVALVFLARDALSASETGYSLLVSVYGLGMILASVMLLGVLRTSPSRTLLLGLLLMGLGTLLTAISPVFLATIGLQIMAGVGNGFQNIGNYTLLQLTVSKDIMGRVFGTTLSVAFAADSLASAVAGSLLETTSPRVVFLISGIGILFAALLIWWLLKREREIL